VAQVFLNVEQSATGRRWVGPDEALDRHAQMIVQETGYPHAMANVLARLGVEAADAARFVAPSLRDLMPDPNSLKDMGKAAARINGAVVQGQRIAIFADYDVDGATSAALLHDWLTQLGNVPTIYVPDRIDGGQA